MLASLLASCGNVPSPSNSSIPEDSNSTNTTMSETSNVTETTTEITESNERNPTIKQQMNEALGLELPYIKLSDDPFSIVYPDEITSIPTLWISDDIIGDIASEYSDILLENNYAMRSSNQYVLMLNGKNIFVQVTYGEMGGTGIGFNIIAWAEKAPYYKDRFPTEELEVYLDGYENIIPKYTADLYYFQLIDDEEGSKPYFRIYSIFDKIDSQEETYKKLLLDNNWTIDDSDYANVGLKAVDNNETITIWFYQDTVNNIFALSIMKMDPKAPIGEKITIDKSNSPSSYETTTAEFILGNYKMKRQNINNAGGVAFKSHSKGESFIYNVTSIETGIKAIVFNGVEQPQKGSEAYQDEITVYSSTTSGEKTTKITGNTGETQVFYLKGANFFYIENLKNTAFNCVSIDIILA